jgi:hypothetical protein
MKLAKANAAAAKCLLSCYQGQNPFAAFLFSPWVGSVVCALQFSDRITLESAATLHKHRYAVSVLLRPRAF